MTTFIEAIVAGSVGVLIFTLGYLCGKREERRIRGLPPKMLPLPLSESTRDQLARARSARTASNKRRGTPAALASFSSAETE